MRFTVPALLLVATFALAQDEAALEGELESLEAGGDVPTSVLTSLEAELTSAVNNPTLVSSVEGEVTSFLNNPTIISQAEGAASTALASLESADPEIAGIVSSVLAGGTAAAAGEVQSLLNDPSVQSYLSADPALASYVSQATALLGVGAASGSASAAAGSSTFATVTSTGASSKATGASSSGTSSAASSTQTGSSSKIAVAQGLAVGAAAVVGAVMVV